jgi:hypothetical protein
MPAARWREIARLLDIAVPRSQADRYDDDHPARRLNELEKSLLASSRAVRIVTRVSSWSDICCAWCAVRRGRQHAPIPFVPRL